MLITRRCFLGATAGLGASLALPSAAMTAGTDRTAKAVTATAEYQANRAVTDAIKSGACPGVVARVTRHGQDVFTIAKGAANLETDTPMAPEGIFRIGSLTKQFTAAMVVKLASRGKVNLDDPAQRYLPFFPANRPFTLRELANQTAGIHSGESDGSCLPGASASPSQIELARAISKQKKVFDFPPRYRVVV